MKTVSLVVMGILVAAAAACTGDRGPAGPAGPSGSDGTNGTNGSNGMNGSNGTNGSDIIISDRAKHGLDIAPVALATAGKTAAEIEAIGQGSYLLNAVGDCSGCHGQPGSTPGYLAGVTTAGTFNARNLTPDPTTGLQLTEAQFIDVIRNGTNYTCSGGTCTSAGNALVVMPWTDFRWASTNDLKAVYAYLRAIPPVVNAVAADTGTHGTVGNYTGAYTDIPTPRALPAETDAMGNPIPDPDSIRRGLALQALTPITSTDATTEAAIGRGAYLITSFGACNACHTNPARVSGKINVAAYLTGGHVFSFPAAVQPGIGVVRSMTADLLGQTHGFFTGEGGPIPDFALFEGILDTGSHIDDTPAMPLAAPMPWQHLRNMTLQDQVAIYTYLTMVGAQHAIQGASDKKTQAASYYCAANTDCDQAASETCDLTTTSATYHECVGRACQVDSDCRTCQTCTVNNGAGTCGGPIITGCSAGI